MVDEHDTEIRFRFNSKLQKIQRREKQACEALQIIHTVAGCASNKLISVIGLWCQPARFKNWNMLWNKSAYQPLDICHGAGV